MKPPESFLKVIRREPTPVTAIDLKTLSEVYDEREIYLSIYVGDYDPSIRHIRKRLSTIMDAVEGKVEENLIESVEMAKEYIYGRPLPRERGRAIFVSAEESLLHVYPLAVEVEPMVVLDTSPFLLPLAKLRDDYEDYAVLYVDSSTAYLYMVRSDIVEKISHLKTYLKNRHKKGGMSQMRFNRLRRESIEHFFNKVVQDLKEELSGVDIRGILILGPGEAKKALYKELPGQLKEKVIDLLDTESDLKEEEIIRMGDERALEDEVKRSEASVEELKEAVLKGVPSAYGPEEVRDALLEGRVRKLVILKDLTIPGWICERCQWIEVRRRPPKKCPRCGGPPSVVDVVEELYELAMRTGSEVEFVSEAPFLEGLGGLGALLRY